MQKPRERFASVCFGSTKKIGLRLVAEGRFQNLSEAAGLDTCRLAEDHRVVYRLDIQDNEGKASGIDAALDVNVSVGDTLANA